jgi:hypothetical protein
LVAQGYVGRALTATLIGCAPNWGATLDRAYQADFANGANLMTITGGHQIDALCYCLGEFRELSAFAVSQRDRIVTDDQGEVALTSPDQLAVSGIVGDGAVVSFQILGGMARGTEFLFEIHGTDGDLIVASTTGGSMQRQELSLHGAQGKGAKLAELPILAKSATCPTRCRRIRRTTSLSFTRSWARASVLELRSVPASMLPSDGTTSSMPSSAPQGPGRSSPAAEEGLRRGFPVQRRAEQSAEPLSRAGRRFRHPLGGARPRRQPSRLA